MENNWSNKTNSIKEPWADIYADKSVYKSVYHCQIITAVQERTSLTMDELTNRT